MAANNCPFCIDLLAKVLIVKIYYFVTFLCHFRGLKKLNMAAADSAC
jgi:hypothetical protein